DSARDHRDRDRARARRVHAVRHLCVVGSGDVAAAAPPGPSGAGRAMSARVRYLAEMGIPVYALRRAAGAAVEPHAASTVPEAAAAPPVEARIDAVPPAAPLPASPEAWRALEAEVRDCTRCPLHRGRT